MKDEGWGMRMEDRGMSERDGGSGGRCPCPAAAKVCQRRRIKRYNEILPFFALPYSTSVVMGLSALSLEWSGACVADVVDGAVGAEWWMRERGT